MTEKIRIGGFLSAYTLTADDQYFSWKGPGVGFKVPRKLVKAVTVEETGWGFAAVKLLGEGTELARAKKIPRGWAEQAMTWLNARI